MDLGDIVAPALGGGAIAALAMKLFGFSANRNIGALDETIKSLNANVAANSAQMQSLRETLVGVSKDVGNLSGRFEGLEKRVDGQGTHYASKLDELRRDMDARIGEVREQFHERMEKATHAMLETVEQIARANNPPPKKR